MKFKNQHIKNIISANNDNCLAIFVGAGISKSSETKSLKLPSWWDLIADLKKELNLNEDETDYLKIAQFYYLEFKESSYHNKLKKYFPDNIKPSLLHKFIFEINPQVIITTNWDSILENAIEENAYIYDVISSDKDLVKSTLAKKVIKMHGDFKNHNIVFKEDDYLNYQYNFPLIENYIKSILSTHVVLFLGYSYNDINLKLIMSWLNNNSSVRPPMYLATFEDVNPPIKYLENQGIITLLLDDYKSDGALLSTKSNKILHFLTQVKDYDKTTIINSDEDTVDFVYNKLIILKDLEGILLEQIQKTLTNCGFFYDGDSKPILEFYDTILTYDNDKVKRDIYKNFINVLIKYDAKKYQNSKLNSIFEILIKANIKGIIITKNDTADREKQYINFDNYIKTNNSNELTDYFDFNLLELTKPTKELNELFIQTYKLYQLKRHEEAFSLIEELIALCMKQRSYTLLLIAMFDRNVLLRILKRGFNRDREKYTDLQEYNLQERFNDLPKDLHNALEPFFNFLNFSYLYKFSYAIAKELKNKEDSKKTILSGGTVLSRNITESSTKHENLIQFVLQNKIMIEDYEEYKTIINDFVKIAIVRQVQEEQTVLNRIELFSCIKYINNKELKEILKDFHIDLVKKGKFNISVEDKDWLINKVFENIEQLHIESKDFHNGYEEYIENIIFILSLVKHTDIEIEQILSLFQKIINNNKTTFGLYQSINNFLGIQYHLYKTEIEEKTLLNLIENIIYKFVYRKSNGIDYHIVTRNEVSNLYGYARESNAVLKNENLIDKLLMELKEFQVSEKLDISQSLLLSLYDISNEQIRNKIKNFVNEIDSSTEELYKRIIFELWLVIYEFKDFNDNVLVDLNEYLKEFEDGKRFSSILFNLDGQIDSLINEKNINQLKECSEKIKAAIDIYKSRKNFSIF